MNPLMILTIGGALLFLLFRPKSPEDLTAASLAGASATGVALARESSNLRALVDAQQTERIKSRDEALVAQTQIAAMFGESLARMDTGAALGKLAFIDSVLQTQALERMAASENASAQTVALADIGSRIELASIGARSDYSIAKLSSERDIKLAEIEQETIGTLAPIQAQILASQISASIIIERMRAMAAAKAAESRKREKETSIGFQLPGFGGGIRF